MASEGAVRIGRFVVLAEISADARGTVYAAYDPQLDRKVALKVVDASTDAIEVRALARLRHPNVVAVHEVGTHRGERFIAMDLVDGVPLRTWLQSQRGWRQIVDLLAQACSALAAAHAVGIVHRSFDADSVLVEHGQAKVVGFASTVHDAATDEADDQRALCTMALEALAAVRVPSRLRRALTRGLATDPAARWPNMAALLQELARPRRRPLAIVVGAAALAGTTAGALVVAASNRPSDRCATKPARLAEIWNEAIVADIAAAFAATDLPFAADGWRHAHERLDRYAEAWAEQHHEACVATYERGQQSEAMFDARMRCLDRRLDELASLTEVLAQPDATVVTRAVQASNELGSLDACADVDELAREHSDDTPARAELARLARAQVDLRTGHYAEARADACALAADADANGFADLAGAAHLLCAQAQQQIPEHEAAIASARTAIERAEAASDDRLRAEAEILLVVLHAERLSLDRAFDWARLARGTLARLADPIDLSTRLSAHEGFALHAAKRFDEALVVRREVLAVREETCDELDPDVASAHVNLAFTLSDLGRLSEAREHFAAALDLRMRAFGELHPAVARAHYELGSLDLQRGEYDAAGRELQLALDVGTRALGPEHPTVGRAYVELANLAMHRGELDDAVPQYERGIAILERTLAPDDPEIGSVLGNYGALLARMPMPRPLQAIELLTRARGIQVAALGPDHPELTYVDLNLTVAYLATNQLDAASNAAASAVRIPTGNYGFAHGLVARGWLSTGDVAVARHDLPAATRAYETALAAFEASESRPYERAVARFSLAKVLADSGDPKRAVTLARAAHQEFLADAPRGNDGARDVAAWLAAHP